jgi:hypothetical protein
MINPRVEKVKAIKDFQLLIMFTNGEEKVFDMKPYLDKGVLKGSLIDCGERLYIWV